MASRRILKINSLLKEVISEVIKLHVRNPNVSELLTITQVDTTQDLYHAKVYVSIIGSEDEKQKTIEALQTASGYIGMVSSKRVVLRHFPTLTFKLDASVEHQMRIDAILKQIHEKDS